MKVARRILTTTAVTLVAVFVCLRWASPVALSFYAARKVPAVARVVPTELQDHSISRAPGMRLSYVGYEFEIPWDDLDESKTQIYPKDKPTKTRAVLAFRSGLRVMVSAIPPRGMADGFTKGDLGFGKMTPQAVELLFGHGAATSDYAFVNNVYEFTPDKMHCWSLNDRLHAREMILLTVCVGRNWNLSRAEPGLQGLPTGKPCEMPTRGGSYPLFGGRRCRVYLL
ncbi:MAG: hypothetical protein WBV55_16550 [Candidatus Sulfotelmatobacter sp.]